MQIHGYGEIIWCREVIFENGKYDRLGRHPGIVIIPTSERDEKAYCLHMTSDKRRINRNKNRYVECRAAVKRGTCINIGHIIKRNNSMDSAIIDEMDENDFFELLKKFYDYQMNLEQPEEEFLEIKDKVEVLLELLDINHKVNIENGKIRYDELSKFLTINDIKKVSRIYSAKLMIKNESLKSDINKKCLNSEKDRIYVAELVSLYKELSERELNKVDINNHNNLISRAYNNAKQNNCLINMDMVFYDLIELFKVSGKELKDIDALYKFIRYQEEQRQKQIDERIKREEKEKEEKIKKEERFNRKQGDKKQKRRAEAELKKKKKRAALVEKYGEFDWD